jgi:hypothetical protein
MMFKGAITTLAAFSLVGAPVVAQAASATVEQARVGTDIEGESLRGGVILPLVALIAAILAIMLVTDSGEDPVSPG